MSADEYEERIKLLKVVWMDGVYDRVAILEAIDNYKKAVPQGYYQDLVDKIEKTSESYELWKRHWGVHSRKYMKERRKELNKCKT